MSYIAEQLNIAIVTGDMARARCLGWMLISGMYQQGYKPD